MAHSVLVVSESGTGKSTSIRNLTPSETFIINIANKPLPFKGWRSQYPVTTDKGVTGNMSVDAKASDIIQILRNVNKRTEIKNVVIDDLQYMSAFEYFERSAEKGFEKFTQMATELASLARIPQKMRDDMYVFFLTHAEDITDAKGERKTKAKTIGKMIDNSLTLEGLFSIVLFGRVVKTQDGEIKYVFETQNNGENTCKSPDGMFDDFMIPNDLQYVRDAIITYENA